MRILIVTPEYPPHAGGGILKYYRTLAPALVRRGADVCVVVAAPTSPDFADYEADGVRVVCVRRGDVEERAGTLAQFSAAPEFRRWLAAALVAREAAGRLGPWDVIEAVDFGLGFAAVVLDRAGPPVVVQLHGSLGQIADHEPVRPQHVLDATLARLAEMALLPCAAELQTYASGNAREWQARVGRPVTVLPPPLSPLPAIGGAAGREALVVGRIQSWKGPATLCDAVRMLPAEFPGIRWVGRDTATAPGGGSLLQHLAEGYPDVWGRRITADGQRPFDEVRQLMAGARMVIVPSSWDVFNLTAVEAMSAGRVVVCSSAAGASDCIASGRNGFVFDAGDPASLASAMREADALSDAERARLGHAARDTVAAQLDPDTVAMSRLGRYRALQHAVRAGSDEPADWLRRVFGGSEAFPVGKEFLDQWKVGDLSRYLGRRIRNRLANRLGGGA